MAKYKRDLYEDKKYTVQGLFYKERLSIPEIAKIANVPVSIVDDYILSTVPGILTALNRELAKAKTPEERENAKEAIERQIYLCDKFNNCLDDQLNEWGI